MYTAANMYPGRRKTKLPRTSAMNLKTVEVPRGRNGYGFTVSGQSPCVLSCILHGSPAEIAGIKTGDSVIAVNGENVTRLSHEQIIKLIGATTGVLRLTVAEMDYSESSDDEYVYMPRTRYPHSKRSQSATPLSMMGNKPRAEMVVEEMQQGALLDSFSSMHADMPPAMLRGAEVQRIQADVQISSSKFAPGHLSPLNQPGNADMLLKRSPNYDYSYWNGKSLEKLNIPPKTRKPRRHNDPRNRMFSTPTPTSYYIRENPYDDNDPEMRPLSPVELSHLMYPGNDTSHDVSRSMHKSMSLPGNANHSVSQGVSMGASLMENNENVHMRAMVGYLGSIDIPASANLPTASLHAIRGCVRRLHKEHRVHSFMMMEVRTDGVRLVNSNQRIAVVYPRERLAFSGVCPDDKRFFGIVTSQNPEEMLDTMDSDDEPIGSSCHVFMVDPEFRRHDVHARVISQFGIPCNTNPETNTCDIFPSSAKPILQQVSQLYRDRSDLSYFGELYGQSTFVSGPRRSNSTNSSNSDSGFGNGNSKDQADFSAHNMDQSHHNPILDVASLMRNKRGGGNRHIVQADVNASLSSDVPYSLSSTSPQSIDTSPQNLFFKNTKDISGRLTPRARPDPVGFRSPSVVPVQQENAFRYQQQAARPSSVQVPLQSQIQHSAPELKQFKQPGIDFSAHKPNAESSGSSTLEDNSQRGKELMGPPKGLPPSGRHSLYSKPSQDYLDAAIDQATARKVQQEMARRLSENQSFHQKQQLLRRNSDCSEYSSSTRLSKQAIERLQKIRQDPIHHTSSIQQTLATSETDLNHDGRGIHSSASNPNLAAQGSGLAELDPSIGRVSSWAVDFERLLADELGLACFTEFLKKEFSDENIMFWIACENMSKIKDHKELQRMAQEIYKKHLAPKAPMPVNLDSGARSMVEGAMKNPTPEMYKVQQQQIFKLMKFDSYSRFLKSKLYQDCVLAEMGGLPLPISLEKVPSLISNPPAGDPEDSSGIAGVSGGIASEGGSSSYEKAGGEKNGGVVLGGTVKDRMERKKSGNKKDTNRNGIPNEKEDDGQDKKRSSILPWRNRQKKTIKEGDKTSSGNEDTSVSSRHSSVTSSDFKPAGDKFVDMNHCFHMIFPNNEILTLTPDPQQSIKGILLPLLEERGLGLQNVEIFLNDTKESVESVKQKLINLEQLATEMIGKQIVVERRVVFKIELPNKRVIGVKSKLTKKIIEVLRPVTYKYKLQLDALVVHLSDSPVPLDLDITVASLDGQRILIETLEQYSAGSYSIGGRASLGPASESQQKPAEVRASSVDSYLKDDEAVRADSSKPAKEIVTAQVSAPTMSAFQPPQGDTMRDQRNLAAAAAAKAAPQVKNLPPSSSTSISTSALGKGRTEGRAEARKAAGNLKVTGKETEDLIAMVSKVQGKRLDDQRGLTLRNLELPDFLKVTSAHTSSSTSAKPVDSRPKSALAQPYRSNGPVSKQPDQDRVELKASDIEALKLRPKSTPPRQSTFKGNDEDAFTDGVLPTQEQADALFGSASPRSPVVRFEDSVVSSSYKETSWGQGSYVNYPQNTDKLRPSVANSYQMGTKSFGNLDSKLSPRAYSNGHVNGHDSTDYGQNTTAYSLEFNSSFGSMDQPNLDTTLTSTSSDPQLPPPPTPDMDTTIQAELPNYTPPPAIGEDKPPSSIFSKMGSQSTPDVRKTPILHPFRSGSTLPGHGLDIATKPVVESNGYVSKACTRSISVGQLSYSNNNNTNLPFAVSVPDIKEETNNCYSNYCPLPTTPNGSSYGGSSSNIDDLTTSPTSSAPPDVTQVHAKERVIKPPPAYHSSMSTRQQNAAYTSSEDLRGAPATHPTGQNYQQGAVQSATWSTSTANPGSGQGWRPSQGAAWSGQRGNASQAASAYSTSTARGYRGPVPYSSVQPPRVQPNSQGAVTKPHVSGSGGYSGTNNLGAGSSSVVQGEAQGRKGSGEGSDLQGKETVVICKDGRKVRATFV